MKSSLQKKSGRKSPLINLHEDSIEISFDLSTYTSPDIFKAAVSLINQKMKKLGSLVVEIEGREEITFLDMQNNYKPVMESRIFFSKTITLLSTDQSEWTLTPNQHVFSVFFHLPKGLPSSFETFTNDYINGSIGYKLIVRAKPTDLSLTQMDNHFFVINPDVSGESIN